MWDNYVILIIKWMIVNSNGHFLYRILSINYINVLCIMIKHKTNIDCSHIQPLLIDNTIYMLVIVYQCHGHIVLVSLVGIIYTD